MSLGLSFPRNESARWWLKFSESPGFQAEVRKAALLVRQSAAIQAQREPATRAATEDLMACACGGGRASIYCLPTELGLTSEDFIKPLPSWHLCWDKFSFQL